MRYLCQWTVALGQHTMAGVRVPGQRVQVKMAWRPYRSKRMLQSIKRDCQDCILLCVCFLNSSGFVESRLSHKNNQEKQ